MFLNRAPVGNQIKIDFVVLTATDIESKALHLKMLPLETESAILPHPVKAHTYYIGKIGPYNIAHAQCEMGSLGSKGSLITTADSIDTWNPLAVIMIGICFGSNSEAQNVGDALVASQIIGYDTQKVKDSNTIGRPRYFRAGRSLIDRFRSIKVEAFDYSVNFFDKKKAVVKSGDLLSGEKLIDDIEYRNELLKAHPEALGGEMEGIGVASACEARNREWLLFKCICDFADGKKGENKKEKQSQAAIAAASLLELFLTSAKDLQSSIPGKNETTKLVDAPVRATEPNPLFNAYSPEHEPFYLERPFDKEVVEFAKDFDLWVFGTTGIGKTCCLTRASENLQVSKVSICLANATYDYEAILNELYQNLHLKEGREMEVLSIRLEKLTRILDLIRSAGQHYLVVFDEVPLNSFEYILTLIYELKKMASETGFSVRFFVSSHANPHDSLDIADKFLELISFKKFPQWTTLELSQLAVLINAPFKIVDLSLLPMLSEEPVTNPRKLKTVFKQFKAARSAYQLPDAQLMKKVIGDLYAR